MSKRVTKWVAMSQTGGVIVFHHCAGMDEFE